MSAAASSSKSPRALSSLSTMKIMKTMSKSHPPYTAFPRLSTGPSHSRLPTIPASSSGASSVRTLYTSPATSPGNPLGYFDAPSTSPPPSNPRTHHVMTSRLGLEARGEVEGGSGSGQTGQQHHLFPLALTGTPSHPSQNHHNLYNSTLGVGSAAQLGPCSTASTAEKEAQTAAELEAQRAVGKQRQKVKLDIGGYGIPKRQRASTSKQQRHSLFFGGEASGSAGNLSVQVGEDAYFIRENAIGVADGVGGWAKTKYPGLSPSSSSSISAALSPSALFARRLMHFCSSEVGDASRHMSTPYLHQHATRSTSISQPTSSFFSDYSTQQSHINSEHTTNSWYWAEPPDPFEMQEQLEESLEELEEGIDVLMILERAYQSTLKAHVVPAALVPPTSPQPNSQSYSYPSSDGPSSLPFSRIHPVTSSLPEAMTKEPVPLLAGSSTALLAVLDHIPRRRPRTDLNAVTGETATSDLQASTEAEYDYDYEAVIKIANIGDCMGMLVRGEEIMWRSEEMWWSFNTPVQLGPCSSSTISPSTAAHLFTLPVQADDILILASDGLGDNLWDEDVLDEVSRFRRQYLDPSQSSETATTAQDRIKWRRALAGMLSEALCSRARRVSELRASSVSAPGTIDPLDTPFARRAKEQGTGKLKDFKGGKNDDISVVVAVISPVGDLQAQESGMVC